MSAPMRARPPRAPSPGRWELPQHSLHLERARSQGLRDQPSPVSLPECTLQPGSARWLHTL